MSGRSDGRANSRWGGRDCAGREDIGCLLAEVRALFEMDVCPFKHSQRMMRRLRPVSSPSALALVRRSFSFSQFCSPDPFTSIMTVWPALKAARRSATAASDVLSKEAVKVTGNLVEGTEGAVPLSKLNGTETASTVMPA
jgi:hypothetical protein